MTNIINLELARKARFRERVKREMQAKFAAMYDEVILVEEFDGEMFCFTSPDIPGFVMRHCDRQKGIKEAAEYLISLKEGLK